MSRMPRGLGKEGRAKWIRADLTRGGQMAFQRLQVSGVEWVEWLGTGLDNACQHCQAWDGKIQRLDELNGICEHAACTHPLGCRCVCGPASDEDIEIEIKRLNP